MTTNAIQFEARFHRVPGHPELVQFSLVRDNGYLDDTKRVSSLEADRIKARALLTGTPIKEYRPEHKYEDPGWAVGVLRAAPRPTRVIRRRKV